MNEKNPHQNIIRELVYEALKVVDERGGNVPYSEVKAEIEKRKGSIIPSALKEKNSRGRIDWEGRLAGASLSLFDNGYLSKRGTWQEWNLTSEGKRMLNSSANYEEFFAEAKRKKAENTQCAYHLAYLALQILKENGGKMLLAELQKTIEAQESHAISPELKDRTPSGMVRWHNRMRKKAKRLFEAAGYLRMSGGTWYLTPEGEEALAQGNEKQVIKQAKIISRKRRGKGDADGHADSDEDHADADGDADVGVQPDSESEDADSDEGAEIEAFQSIARTAIKEYIHSMDPYDFQDLCAALLRGMGYFTPEVAARGADGGIDIVAYTDPLGGKSPRVKVQVKRYRDGSNISIQEVDMLAGKIRDGEIGVFVTTSGFTRDCRRSARDNPRHIELIDFERFVELWITHYDKLPDEDKKRLPLQPIYFLSKE